MARRQKRLWTDDEKLSICQQTTAPGVSVAQVAQRYALNANLIFKWLRDPRYSPTAAPVFLPVEVIDGDPVEDSAPAERVEESPGHLEIDLVGGHRLRVIGAYDADVLACLIRRLST